MTLPRPYIPVSVRLAVALRQLGFRKPELDHSPALVLRAFDEKTGIYTPDANDPDHLVYREGDGAGSEHDVKTNGLGGEKRITTRGSDKFEAAKTRRLTKQTEEARRNMLAKAPGESRPRTSRIASRGFDKTKTRKLNRQVVERT